MTAEKKSVIIIGGGPAGLAAAGALHRQGVSDILILEREPEPGGILRQCIHDGFGLTRFAESLSGPEYAARFIDEIHHLGIEIITDSTVIQLGSDKTVVALTQGRRASYKADAVILAMGCRERTRGAIRIPGTRPAGIYTAGVAQSYMNLKNIMVGKEAVILGSGDIGLIMARRLTLEGARVKGVFEILPFASGLPRNVEQCLHDYQIPLHLSHTITDIHGRERLEAVSVSRVDQQFTPVPGTDKTVSCDTLILSVGLIPENELSGMAGIKLDQRTKGPLVDEFYQTSVSGIFAAGNVLHVHDLVDYVSLEAERMAASVAAYLASPAASGSPEQIYPDRLITIEPDEKLGYTVPQHVSGKADFTLSFRPRNPAGSCSISIIQDNQVLQQLTLKRAIPAEMIQMAVRRNLLISRNNIKVVMSHE